MKLSLCLQNFDHWLKWWSGAYGPITIMMDLPNMDKVEAYHLLTTAMGELANDLSEQSTIAAGDSIELDVAGTQGATYRLGMVVTQNPKGGYTINGTVHDNNSQQFSLLEEKLDFQVRDNGCSRSSSKKK
ncbi:MAG: hypothetical protein ABJN26_13405 [Stappiaceae bacterium]